MKKTAAFIPKLLLWTCAALLLPLLASACIQITPAPPTATAQQPSVTTTVDETETATPDPAASETSTLTPTPVTTTEADPTITPTPTPKKPDLDKSALPIPAQADWVDLGTIFEAGGEGEWDHLLWGGFAFSVIEWNGVTYLYYQGSIDYSAGADETNMWRAIGVATSQDGYHFQKYAGSPVLEWFPNQNLEEGAVSSGVTLGEDGLLYLFYGANTQETATTVNADTRASSSPDGFTFTDLGPVLSFRDPGIWGSGDELYAVDAIYYQGRWIVYYIPNGSAQSGKLGVAYGERYDQLSTTTAVNGPAGPVAAWGAAGHIFLNDEIYLLVINNIREDKTEIRRSSVSAPDVVSDPLKVYQFGDNQKALILLDEERLIWIMYYFDIDRYGVRVAPAGERDGTSPATPAGLAITVENQQASLTWEPSSDPDSGIWFYRIYRSGALIGTSPGVQFTDLTADGSQQAEYQVSAVNFHGLESSLSAPVTAVFSED